RRTASWSPAPRQQRSRPVRSTTAAQAQPGSGKNPSLRSSRPDPATAATTARPPNPPRPRSRFASARAIDQRGGAKARQDVDQHYFTSKRFDDLVADHLLAPIVATLHQHARPDRGDQPDRRVFREDHDEIDRFECGENFRSRPLVLDWTTLAFQPHARSVAVEANDQAIAGGTCRGQNLDVAGMQDIETAVGETDPQAFLTPIRKARIELAIRDDFFLRREERMRQDFPPSF